jgi:hypothetical protein
VDDAPAREDDAGAMPRHASLHDPPMNLATHRLVEAAAEIMGDPIPTDRDRAFMARQLVQATLPHKDPGDVPVWTRSNGRVTLVVRPHFDRKAGRHVHPYGTVPRLLLFWLTTEAVRTKSRTLHPGSTLSEFMRELGLNPDNGSAGAKRSDARRLRDQMLRLFRATISFEVTEGNDAAGVVSWLDMPVTTGGTLWWDYREPRQGALFESSIELGERFFEAIVAAPVPVDMRALRALKRSPLALDLYGWATYRTFTVTETGKAAFIPWTSLAAQMGADYATAKDFRKKAVAALRKVQSVYPALRLADADGGIIIKPSAPAVPRRGG